MINRHAELGQAGTLTMIKRRVTYLTSGPSRLVSFMRIWAKGITVFFSSCSFMLLREGSAFICERQHYSAERQQ